MNDIFQKRYRTPAVHTPATVYACERALDQCKAALWTTAQSDDAITKIGVGVGGRKCVCHLHDKTDGG